MKKVIYCYIVDKHIKKIVDFLDEKHNWKPLIFLNRSEANSEISKYYKNSIFLDKMKLRKGEFDYSFIEEKIPVGEDVLNNLSRYEHTYLEWLQDTSGWNFSITERKRYFHEMLNYWNSIITLKKPDLFISYTVPHMPEDYALYLICKYHFKIPTIFLDIYPHFNQNYFSIHGTLENLSETYIQEYNSERSNTVSQDIKNYIEKLKRDPKTPIHITEYMDYHKDIVKRQNIFQDLKHIIYLFLKGKVFKEAPVAFKKSKKPFLKSQLNNLEYFFFLKNIKKRNRKLFKIYNKYVEKINNNDNFVYFAAPYQPEIYSNLAPGNFKDVFLILDILTTALPKGWKIYYKEHPNTFNEGDYAALAKDTYYYKKIKKYKNIVFISSNENSFNLIDKSKAVATTGGTVGMEATIKNKPVLLFGNHWYSGCKSVFNILKHEDAKNAFIKIKDGYRPNSEDVKKYIQSIYNCSFKHDLNLESYIQKKGKKNNSESFLDDYFYEIGKNFFNAYIRLYEKKEF